jgi:hypothetical protein
MVLIVKSNLNGTGICNEHGYEVNPEDLKLPQELILEFKEWLQLDADNLHDMMKDDIHGFEFTKFFELGLNLAKKLKKYVGNDHKVIYEYSEVKLLPSGDIQYTPLHPLEIVKRKVSDMIDGFKYFSENNEISDEELAISKELEEKLEEFRDKIDELKKNIPKESIN